MTPSEQTQAAAAFAEFWADKGDEKQETSRFWIDLLQNVLGIGNPAKYIEFEKRVKLSHTSFIDAYIPDTKVLIEQKGAKVDLHRAYEQSDGSVLTPYEQAKRYADEMPNSLRPRWIVVCNFQEFLVYDLEKPGSEPEQIFLKDLEKEHYRLQFLADAHHDYLRREEELSLQAGVLVGKLYDGVYQRVGLAVVAIERGFLPVGVDKPEESATVLKEAGHQFKALAVVDEQVVRAWNPLSVLSNLNDGVVLDVALQEPQVPLGVVLQARHNAVPVARRC